MIRKFFLILICAMASCAIALGQQTGEHSVYRKGGELLTRDGVKIDRSTALKYMSSETYYEYYTKGHKLFKSGIILSSVGAGVIVGTVAFDLINGSFHKSDPQRPTSYVPIVSIAGCIVGGTMLLVSVPLYIVGTVKLNKAAELSFVSPSGGVGLVLNF